MLGYTTSLPKLLHVSQFYHVFRFKNASEIVGFVSDKTICKNW
jgi:hypothetical protein